METEIKKITPEIASELLAKNSKNRPISTPTVKFYADQMKKGQWELTSQGITIADCGTVIDGQHRLLAIIESGTTQEMLIFYGLDFQKVFAKYDVGKKRSPGDALAIAGVKNSKNIAAIIKVKYRLDAGNNSSRSGGGNSLRLSNPNVIKLYYQNPDVYNEVFKQSSMFYNKFKYFTIGQLGGMIAHLIMTKNHNCNYVFDFFRQFSSGKNITNNTIEICRELFINDAMSNRKMTSSYRTIVIKKTWNNYVQGIHNKSYIRVDIERDSNLIFM